MRHLLESGGGLGPTESYFFGFLSPIANQSVASAKRSGFILAGRHLTVQPRRPGGQSCCCIMLWVGMMEVVSSGLAQSPAASNVKMPESVLCRPDHTLEA